ncbi:UNVERIFIED_CONTAM: hypothetical protein GTU68_015462 [Idotea baltica]|nr:hypothetical protein [Idotea baltica]
MLNSLTPSSKTLFKKSNFIPHLHVLTSSAFPEHSRFLSSQNLSSMKKSPTASSPWDALSAEEPAMLISSPPRSPIAFNSSRLNTPLQSFTKSFSWRTKSRPTPAVLAQN